MKFTKKDISYLLPYIVVLITCTYWIITGDKVRNDPYLLGLIRGINWSLLIYSFIRIRLESD
jgi:hypothetical protein